MSSAKAMASEVVIRDACGFALITDKNDGRICSVSFESQLSVDVAMERHAFKKQQICIFMFNKK